MTCNNTHIALLSPQRRLVQKPHKFNLTPIPAEFQHSFIQTCGHCLGCLSKRRQKFTLKGILGLEEHKIGISAVFTFDDDNLPSTIGIGRTKHIRLLKYRIRSFFRYYGYSNIAIQEAGQYGDRFNRIHFHLNIFGIDENVLKKLGDQYLQCGLSRRGYPIFSSSIFTSLWHNSGFVRCQPLHQNHVKYIASYSSKSFLKTGLSSFVIDDTVLHYETLTNSISKWRRILKALTLFNTYNHSTGSRNLYLPKILQFIQYRFFHGLYDFEFFRDVLIHSIKRKIKSLYFERSKYDYFEYCRSSPTLGLSSLKNHLDTDNGVIANIHIPSSWLIRAIDNEKLGDFIPSNSQLYNMIKILERRREFYVNLRRSIELDPNFFSKSNSAAAIKNSSKLLNRTQNDIQFSHHFNSA